MSKKNNAFSLIEILFVMAVMTLLASIAIPSYIEDRETIILATLRVDTVNALDTLKNTRDISDSFTEILGAGYQSNAGTNGESTLKTTNGTKFSLTKGNTINATVSTSVGVDCIDGFILKIQNTEINKMTYFDSCKDTKFKVMTIPN